MDETTSCFEQLCERRVQGAMPNPPTQHPTQQIFTAPKQVVSSSQPLLQLPPEQVLSPRRRIQSLRAEPQASGPSSSVLKLQLKQKPEHNVYSQPLAIARPASMPQASLLAAEQKEKLAPKQVKKLLELLVSRGLLQPPQEMPQPVPAEPQGSACSPSFLDLWLKNKHEHQVGSQPSEIVRPSEQKERADKQSLTRRNEHIECVG